MIKRRGLTKVYTYQDKPIETVNMKGRGKCFTFFSSINKLTRDIEFDLDQYEIAVYPSINWLPLHYLNKYYFALHSPNIIPEFKIGTTLIEVTPGAMNTITYSKMTVDRKYDFGCHRYDDSKSSWTDCMAVCVMKNVQIKYGDAKTLYTSFLLRAEYLDQLEKFNKSKPILYYIRGDPGIEMKQECTKQCRPPCHISYFVYDIGSFTKLSDSDTDKTTIINIQHNHIPDVYLRHLPEITFISFISNFGGLLGMWLGMSVLLICKNIQLVFNHFHNLMSKPKSNNLIFKRTSHNLINQNNQQINIFHL